MTLLHQAAQKAVEAEWMAGFDRLLTDYGDAREDRDQFYTRMWAQAIKAHLNRRPALQHQEVPREPVDMVLYCPDCGAQHIDAPELGGIDLDSPGGLWLNPPHRSHKCHGCDCIWRPADVATNGVAELKTQGKADTWVVRPGQMSGAFPVSDLEAASPSTTRQQEVGSDTARLDWLEQDGTFNFYKVLPEAADKNGHRWRWRHESEPGVRSSAVTKAMPSLRAALDAARAAAPSTPEKAGGVAMPEGGQQ